MPTKATIKDVAAAANVAVGTVSRVLNNFPDVNAESRRRVFEAAGQLHYRRIRRRKAGGTSGRGEETGNYGMILLGMDDTLVHLPVISQVLHGVEMTLAAEQKNLMLANISGINRVPAFLKNNQVDGLIVKAPLFGRMPEAGENELLRSIYRFPVVWLLGKIEGAIGDVSSFDADRAGALAARYLWENGHTSLGFLNPRPGHIQFEKLKQGFATAGRKLGAKCSTLEPEREVTSSWPLPAIRNDSQIGPLVDAWLAINAKARPTALFVPADSIAVHLYTALQKRSLHVGRDMSVISCNHELPITMSLNPSLATLDLNAEQIGCNAVRQLLWRIDHTLERNSVQILIEPRIVPGDSVGVPGDSVGKLR